MKKEHALAVVKVKVELELEGHLNSRDLKRRVAAAVRSEICSKSYSKFDHVGFVWLKPKRVKVKVS